MRHDEFAERAAERLEALAAASLGEEDTRRVGRGSITAMRANALRVAAQHVVRDLSEAATRAERRRSSAAA